MEEMPSVTEAEIAIGRLRNGNVLGEDDTVAEFIKYGRNFTVKRITCFMLKPGVKQGDRLSSCLLYTSRCV